MSGNTESLALTLRVSARHLIIVLTTTQNSLRAVLLRTTKATVRLASPWEARAWTARRLTVGLGPDLPSPLAFTPCCRKRQHGVARGPAPLPPGAARPKHF